MNTLRGAFGRSSTRGARTAPPGTRGVVVGGGIAGVAAATILCERGVDVVLIERDVALGGRAGGFSDRLVTREQVDVERGFHAFFRHYYNLRALLRRIDPDLTLLRPLDDYPILGRGGMVQTFARLPTGTPWQVLAVAWRTPYLRATDLPRVNARAALEMLRFDPERTYELYDRMSATEYLESLAFPPAARRMLLDVFAHSFFNAESEMSAAELLMMFHFYLTANREGIVFDVARRGLPGALWRPFVAWLEARGAVVRTGTSALCVCGAVAGGRRRWRVEHSRGAEEADLLVLALDVAGLRALVRDSEDLAPLRSGVESLSVTRPFAVWRLWLDRPMAPQRAPFVGTTGVGLLDNISIYDRFQEESAAWASAHSGSVIELHAYAVAPDLDEASIKADLSNGFHELYPEARGARIVDERFLWRQDCPAFRPGAHARRPGVPTAFPNVALAGDLVAMPMPCALMERAAASGFLAANTLLAPLGVRGEPIRSVARRGLLSPPRLDLESLALARASSPVIGD
jgi:isorenieratene synthase